MTLGDILLEDGVLIDVAASSKKQALQVLAQAVAARTSLRARDVCDAITERERLGSTGVGDGVAIPHARVADVERAFGIFARLETPIDFDAVDDKPADLIFVLVAPIDAGVEHLKALARVARVLRRDGLRERLRAAPSADAVYALLTDTETAAPA